eukprot:CAMPEP_0185848234 /NCGR_PEP_ID=MMETSP1354-20130828/3196_1 /TAXON_ID=708628 /ORGANISM="Erythrolobus madagascarensis, Strain CCMP3276" /LENGTH=251 /DNA_ID=CAMNT_0028548611 /DNA_START=135 /DNA_END=890 /DNA_ORIENTATION=-
MFGFGDKGSSRPAAVCKVAYGTWGHEHDVGDSKLSLAGMYSSKSNAYGVEATYKIDDSFTVYGAVDLSDTSVHHVGVTGRLEFGDQKVKLDAAYSPGKDSLRAKVAAPIDDFTLTAYLMLSDVSKDPLKSHKEAVEASLKLGNDDEAELFYDVSARTIAGRYTRELDDKNSVRLQYTFESQDKHSGAVKLKHKADDRNSFEVDADLGSRSYSLKWKQNTENGRWTVKTSVPFDSHPKDGQLSIKRRFDLST